MSTSQRLSRALLIAGAICLVLYVFVFSLIIVNLLTEIDSARDSNSIAVIKPDDNEDLGGSAAVVRDVLREWSDGAIRTANTNLSLLQEYVALWDISPNKIAAVITYAVPWYHPNAGPTENQYWRKLSRNLSPEEYKAQLKDKMEDLYSRDQLGALDWLINVRGYPDLRYNLRAYVLDPLGTITIIIGVFLLLSWLRKFASGKP